MPKSKVNICFIIPTIKITGGAEKQTWELLRGIDRNRFSVSLIVFDPDSTETVRGFVDEILPLNVSSGGHSDVRRAAALIPALFKAVRFLRRLKPDIVQTVLPAAAILGGIAARLAGIPVVIQSRRSMAGNYRKNRILAAVDRFSVCISDGLIGNAAAIATEALADDHHAADKVFAVHNGVDTARYTPGRAHDLRKTLGIAEDEIVFGNIGFFRPVKRHVDIVEAAALVTARYPRVRFLFVGHDCGELEVVRRHIGALALDDKFRIVPGTSNPERYQRALDVFVCSSATEGLSNSILEAMACGKPVIATAVGGNSELVVDGMTGLLVPAANPGALAEAMEKLAGDPRLRERMGDEARAIAEREFSLRAMICGYEEIYEKLRARVEADALMEPNT